MSVLVAVDGAGAGRACAVPDDLEFTAPPPGMWDLRRFTLTALDETGYLFALRSADAGGVRLFVVPPRPYFPDYAPALDPTALDALQASADDVVLLVVVHPGQEGAPPTANLLAPVVVNPATGAAVQVVLEGDRWPLRAPLGADSSAA